MPKFNFKTPEFLMCEIPVKDNSPNDDRLWVYHTKSLSLIEFVCVSDFPDFQFKGKMERFEYFNGDDTEDWFGVFVQNNCNGFELDDNDVLKQSWLYLKAYLEWEDKNIG